MFDQEELESVVHDFLVESNENLERLYREFVDLERDPSNREVISSIFRTIHTIKGTCGFLGFTKLEAVAHKGENLLSKLRDGLLQTTHEITTALLSMVDAIRAILAQIENGGVEGDGDYSALVDQLICLTNGEAAESGAASTPAAPVPPSVDAPTPPLASTAAAAPTGQAEAVAVEAPPNQNIGDILIEGRFHRQSSPPPRSNRRQRPRHLGEILVEKGAIRPPDVVNACRSSNGPRRGRIRDRRQPIRVDVNVLDKLMNLVGELVLARNQMQQFMLAVTAGVHGDLPAIKSGDDGCRKV